MVRVCCDLPCTGTDLCSGVCRAFAHAHTCLQCHVERTRFLTPRAHTRFLTPRAHPPTLPHPLSLPSARPLKFDAPQLNVALRSVVDKLEQKGKQISLIERLLSSSTSAPQVSQSWSPPPFV